MTSLLQANKEAARRPVVLASHKKFGHAVVIGSGIAGLTAARVLANYFRQVTVVDRDTSPDPVDFRRGVPQTRHAHRLLPRGQMILERLFPRLVEELLERGAVPLEADKELAVDYEGTWQTGPARPNWFSLSCSRPLLESTLYQRLAATPGVQMMQGYEGARLQTDSRNERVIGVWLLCRRCQSHEVEVTADLVIDASGRNSKAPHWLESLGYTPPEEWSVDSFVGYATRCYDRLPRFLEGFLVYGDAAYILNPIYAQGMTTAAIGSQALDECLAQQPRGDLTGLSRAFQQQLSRSLGRLWHSVTSQDWQWEATLVTDNSEQIYLS